MDDSDARSCLQTAEGQIYLAACSHAPVTKGLRRAMEGYMSDLLEFGNPWDLWMDRVAEAKSLFARLIGAKQDSVFPSFSVSSALASVLSSLDYGGRRGLVVSDMEYPTTNYLMLAQERFGAEVRTIKSRNHLLSPDDYCAAVDGSTKLTSAVHVSSLTGLRQDIGRICSIAHENGSLFYTDAYQSMGTIPLDVRSLDVDFLSSGNLKFLLGLPGTAFMYVRDGLVQELEPASIGWFSQRDPFRFGPEKLEYSPTADRFQSGTLSIPSLYAAVEGMKTIIAAGQEEIWRRISMLTSRAMDVASGVGLPSLTPERAEQRGAIVSFRVRRPHDLENALRSEGIITSSRGEGIRIAPHFYNTVDDIERAVTRISELRDA